MEITDEQLELMRIFADTIDDRDYVEFLSEFIGTLLEAKFKDSEHVLLIVDNERERASIHTSSTDFNFVIETLTQSLAATKSQAKKARKEMN